MIGFAVLWSLLTIACMGTIWYVQHGYVTLTDQGITTSERIIYTIVCGLLILLFGMWARDSYKEAKRREEE